ncbi:uncharacterized protein LOC118436040 [Folsomia candida]|nr:uncharacterized protein LOC118436040 [Folsomia candida]
MYVVPLADSDYEPVATTVGRTVKINDIAGVGRRRATEEECAARRTFKYGVMYAPTLGYDLHLYTNDEEIVLLLKWWCRIFMGAICSLEPSECISKLQYIEEKLKYHLLKFADVLPPSTVEYMQSWGTTPMKDHWNLFAIELQLYQKNPKEVVPVPMATINKIMDALKLNPDAKPIIEELFTLIDSASALAARAKLMPQPEINPFWFSEEKMDQIGHLETNIPIAVELVDEGMTVLNAARTRNVSRTTLGDNLKKQGIKSQFGKGRQFKTGTNDQVITALEMVKKGTTTTYDAARLHGVKRSTVQMRMSRSGIKSTVRQGAPQRHNYTAEDLEKAIQMCESGVMTQADAAEKYKVPPGTLKTAYYRRKKKSEVQPV